MTTARAVPATLCGKYDPRQGAMWPPACILAGTQKRIDSSYVGTEQSRSVLDGDPAERILEYAERESADCIVMGSRGLSDVRGLVLGSVSHKVSNRAVCTCIAVK